MKEYKKFSSGAEAEAKTAAAETNAEGAPSSEDVPSGVKGVVFKKMSTSKEVIAKACEQTFNHNLTICHVNIENLQTDEDDGNDEADDQDKEVAQPQSR